MLFAAGSTSVAGMRPVLTASGSTELDEASTTPQGILMDRAGLAVALAATEMGVAYGDRVVVLTGAGNNGGDGYVAAHYLAKRGVDVTVHPFAPPAGELGRAAAERAVRSGAKIRPWPDTVATPALVIDALFGVGFHGRLHDRILPWTRVGAPVLSVDIPSGVDATTGEVDGAAFRATRTVTFHALKVGHLLGVGNELSGVVTVADIGLSGENALFSIADESDAVPPARSRNAHKWSVGSVMVVGGSPGMTGAAGLAAQAAIQFGAGAAAVAVNAGNQHDYVPFPDLLRPVLGEHDQWTSADVSTVLEAASRFDVLVIGPGLEGCDEFVAQLMERRGGSVLLDAGGLRIPGVIEVLAQRSGETLVTPHAGEFLAMTNEPGTHESAARLAKETASTVLLKGSPTFIASPPGAGGDLVAVTTPGPELATIGTGDVLAGMIAARWASGFDVATAALSATYWHGVAGAELAKTCTVTAGGLLTEIGRWGR